MRMRIVIFLLLVCSTATAFGQTKPSIANNDRIRLAETFRLNEFIGDRIWKDWSKTPFAVMLVTPEYEFLMRHPQPSPDFALLGYDSLLKCKVYFRKRTFPVRLLATFPAISGSSVPTIVVGTAESTAAKTSTPWVVTLFHEHFHQLQDIQPSYYPDVDALNLARGDQTGSWMLNYAFPYDRTDLQTQFATASKLLNDATLTTQADRETKLTDYLNARKQFRDSLTPDDYKYFAFQLWQEGVARYTQYQVAKFAAEKYRPSKQFRALKDFRSFADVAKELRAEISNELLTENLATTKREVVYPFGAAEALLLDEINPSWRERYFVDKFDLAKYYEQNRAAHKLDNQTELPPALSSEDATVIAEAYHLWQSLGEKVWTGWTAIQMPFIYVTHDFEYAIDFPHPLTGFTSLGTDHTLGKRVQARKRVFGTHTAASFPYEGVETVVIGTPKALEKSATAWALTATHEMFHVLQASRGEVQKVAQLKIGPENDPSWQLDFPFPYKDSAAMRLIHLQGYQLYLAATNQDQADLKYDAGTAADAIRVYQAYLKLQSPDNKFYNYSQFQELGEGIAFYTEYKMAEIAGTEKYQPLDSFARLPDYKSYQQTWDDEYKNRIFLVKHAGRAAQTRTAFYHLGLGKGLLLDRLLPDWKQRYFAPNVWLDDLVFAAIGQPSEIPVLKIGALTPDFTLPTIAGENVSLNNYRGKIVVIDFWQTWCPPCIEELPRLRSLHVKYGPQGLAVVGISGKSDADSEKDLRELIAQHRIDYPSLLDQGGRVAAQYGISGYPHVFVLDRTGKLIYEKAGYNPGDELELETQIQRALAASN